MGLSQSVAPQTRIPQIGTDFFSLIPCLASKPLRVNELGDALRGDSYLARCYTKLGRAIPFHEEHKRRRSPLLLAQR